MAGASIMWGLMAPLAKDAMSNGISGFSMVGIRVTGGMICFWIASIIYKAILKRKKENHSAIEDYDNNSSTPSHDLIHDKITLKELLRLFGAGMFAIVFNQCNYIVGLNITSPLNASIMTTTMPIITMVLAAIIIKEPITLKKLSGVMLGCLGATTLILASAGGSTGGVLLGDLMCVAGQFSYALYLTAFKKVVSRHHPITCQKWMMTSAFVVLIPFVLPSLIAIDWANISTLTLAETAFVVLGGTFFSFLFSTIAQQILRPTIIAMYNYMQPIVACTASVLLGLGIFTIYHLIAAALVFIGVYLVNASKAAK